jgi:hypothetical protein
MRCSNLGPWWSVLAELGSRIQFTTNNQNQKHAARQFSLDDDNDSLSASSCTPLIVFGLSRGLRTGQGSGCSCGLGFCNFARRFQMVVYFRLFSKWKERLYELQNTASLILAVIVPLLRS